MAYDIPRESLAASFYNLKHSLSETSLYLTCHPHITKVKTNNRQRPNRERHIAPRTSISTESIAKPAVEYTHTQKNKDEKEGRCGNGGRDRVQKRQKETKQREYNQNHKT